MLASKDELENVIEAILFVSGQGVDISDMAEKLEVEEKDIKDAVKNLKEKKKNSGINILTYKNSVQLCSNPDYAEDIATVLNPIREKQLTKAALETLAIIAYKQPITRLDIEEIRGVSSDYAVQVLINFNLIEVVGRKDAVGKPLLFGTTDEFLKRFDIENLDELPDYDELLERIAVLHNEFNDGLYRSTEIIPEDQLSDHVESNDETQNKAKQNENSEEITEENFTADEKSLDEENGLDEKAISEEEVKQELISNFNDDSDEDFYQKDSDLL